MCFGPQRRALFWHLSFQKWSEPVSFLHVWVGNVLRATTACAFLTSKLPKVVRTRQFFTRLSWKCASGHNGVHFCFSPLSSSHFFSSLWLFPPLLFHLSILWEVWLLNFLWLMISRFCDWIYGWAGSRRLQSTGSRRSMALCRKNVLHRMDVTGHTPMIFGSSEAKKIEDRSAKQCNLLLAQHFCSIFPQGSATFIFGWEDVNPLSNLWRHFLPARLRSSFAVSGGCGVRCSLAGPSGCAPRRWVGFDGTWGLWRYCEVGEGVWGLVECHTFIHWMNRYMRMSRFVCIWLYYTYIIS